MRKIALSFLVVAVISVAIGIHMCTGEFSVSSKPDEQYIPTAIPTARQLEFQSWEMGLFLHFGIRTFYEGHQDWDGRPMPPEGFTPTELDCNNWIETAFEAGMKYAVLVCKHHDGFANWPSKFSDYTVAQTPWKDGEGDVVREFVDACDRYGVKPGLYYSPAEWGTPVYEDEKAYDDHFINQVSELLTNYGEIHVLWFDGSGSHGHRYDWKRIIGEIRKLQPNILIFGIGDPDVRWIGNESGMAGLPHWNTQMSASVMDATEDGQEPVQKPTWLPAECDCMLRWGNWFYSDRDEWTVKPLEELMSIYYLSVGRGANLLLNVGPDRRGLLPEADRKRVLEFGEEIRRRFGSPFATTEDGEFTETGWEYKGQRTFFVDHVVLQEDLVQGEAVRRFAIRIEPNFGGELTLYEGRNIGHKAIVKLPLVAAKRVVVEILESDRPVKLKSVELSNSHRQIYQMPEAMRRRWRERWERRQKEEAEKAAKAEKEAGQAD